MEPQETEVEQELRTTQVLKTLTPEADAFLKEVAEDGFSFESILPRDYFNVVGEYIYTPIQVGESTVIQGEDSTELVVGLDDYIGVDKTAPRGSKTPCAYCLSDIICNRAAELYPEDEHLQYLIYKWAEFENAVSLQSFPKKRPSEIVFMRKEFYKEVSSWPIAELHRLYEIFSGIRASLGEHPETHFIPRYITRIHMREQDGELRGQIQKMGEKEIRNGSFVAVMISSDTCFSRLAFTLGLEAGYHVSAACGNADKAESHLYRLKNFRLILKPDTHRQDRRRFEKWGMLYGQTYEDAMKIKLLNDADTKASKKQPTLEDLWSGKVSSRAKPDIYAIWVTGAELEKELGQPDPSLRHTGRAFATRIRNGQIEFLTVTERGDDPEGRTGKPPLVGLPGGMRERGATMRQTICRETENEAQTKRLEAILALVGLHRKPKRYNSDQENEDHWYYVRLDNEAGLSKKMIEGNEIYEVRWLPLSALAECGFQHTRQTHRTVWDVRKVHERKLLSVNHANWISKIVPKIISECPEAGLKLPDNWGQFLENIRKFLSE